MNHSFASRLLALCLALCLLPVAVLAEDVNDGTPVTRSIFALSPRVNADGFPNDGAAHYADWERFLDKISLRGVVDTQSFLSPLSRVYLDGGLYLNQKLTVPFEYDGYYSFRYFRSPALGGASIHFQMFNFFQFMLKGYYYMGLPTQLIAVPLYPEATTAVLQNYGGPLKEIFAGEGSRSVSYDELYQLCETLNLLALEDRNDALYYYVTCLLIDLGASDLVYEKLGSLDMILDHLDPEAQGMTITVDGENEAWVLGETTVLEKQVADGVTTLTVSLPDPDGYVWGFRFEDTGAVCTAQILVTLEGEERLNLTAVLNGLDDPLQAEGTLDLTLTGGALWQEVQPQRFAYRLSRSAEVLPYDLWLEVDWVHPQTGLPALGFAYEASMEELPYTAISDKPYDNQDDFFHLNDSYLQEYKERFLPTVALALAPFALEMPAGILSDLVGFLDTTGLLAFLGIE